MQTESQALLRELNSFTFAVLSKDRQGHRETFLFNNRDHSHVNFDSVGSKVAGLFWRIRSHCRDCRSLQFMNTIEAGELK